MKKSMLNKVVSLVGLFIISAAFIACGKKSDDSNNNVTAATSYYMNNGICYSNLNQQVPTNYCQGQNGGYTMVNGYCYYNNQVVSNSLCSSNGYYTNNGQCYSQQGQIVTMQYCTGSSNGASIQQVCNGQYYDMYNQVGTCYGSNCRGYTLRSVTTGQTVQCI